MDQTVEQKAWNGFLGGALRRTISGCGGGLVCVLVVCAVSAWSAPADAQNRKGSPKVIELDEEVIQGRLQKPEACYILQHASLNYERLDPKETFIPEMIKSVKKKPF